MLTVLSLSAVFKCKAALFLYLNIAFGEYYSFIVNQYSVIGLVLILGWYLRDVLLILPNIFFIGMVESDNLYLMIK